MQCGLVDVIVPCFNQGRFLRAAIESLQAQSLQDWRAIVVDDGSSDETPAVCDALAAREPRMTVLRKFNGGLSSARNAGLRKATAEFVQFLDADDLLEAGKLAAHVACLRRDERVDVVFGNAMYFDDANPQRMARNGLTADPVRRDVDWISAYAADARPMHEKLLVRNQFPVPCALIRRCAVERAGLFDETLPTLEDWDFWMRLALAGARFNYEPTNGADALIRVHTSSLSHQRPKMRLGAYLLAAKDLRRVDDPRLRRIVLARAFDVCRRGALSDISALRAAVGPALLPDETRVLRASLWLHAAPIPFRVVSLLRRKMPQTFGL